VIISMPILLNQKDMRIQGPARETHNERHYLSA
jgi:hypothetical protein